MYAYSQKIKRIVIFLIEAHIISSAAYILINYLETTVAYSQGN